MITPKENPGGNRGSSRQRESFNDGGNLPRRFRCVKCNCVLSIGHLAGSDDPAGRMHRQPLCEICAAGATWRDHRTATNLCFELSGQITLLFESESYDNESLRNVYLGDLLTRLRDELTRGDTESTLSSALSPWHRWCASHLPFDERAARYYMRRYDGFLRLSAAVERRAR